MKRDQFDRIYAVVRSIPAGKVATYGQVGVLATGSPFAARTVGWALHMLSNEGHDNVPWWRVINAQGRISTSTLPNGEGEQRRFLEAEGVVFSPSGRTDLTCFQWDGSVSEKDPGSKYRNKEPKPGRSKATQEG